MGNNPSAASFPGDGHTAGDAERRVPVPESIRPHYQNPHTADNGSPRQSNCPSTSPASAPSSKLPEEMKKVQDREQEIVALRDHLEQEKNRRQEMEQKYSGLLSEIEKLEALHAQQALPGSSSTQVDYSAMEQKVLRREKENVTLHDHSEQEKHHRQEMGQKYNDLSLKPLHAQQVLPDSGSAQVDYRAMEQKALHREQEIVALRNHLEQEIHRRQEMEPKYIDLHLKIEKLEALHRQQALTDSGSYQDSTPTPPLLQNAADGVKDAIVVCAHEFFAELRKSQSIIDIYAVRIGIPLQQRSNEVTKAGLQAVLCRVLFQGFEDPYFTFTENHNSPFQTSSEQKTALFQAFRTCRDCSEAMHLLRDDVDFRGFFHAKAALMNEEIKTWIFSSSDAEWILNGILNPRNKESIYNRKFLRAAKTVWVLHKLAMAFEPSAEVFRVTRGSFLSGTYMEDVATHDEEAEGNENTLPQKQVLFMCVPGFIVRHTVIKSRVFCLLNTKPGSSDTH